MHNFDVLAPVIFGTACVLGFALGLVLGFVSILELRKKYEEYRSRTK